MLFAENLKKIMEEQGIAQKDLCLMALIPPSSMSQYLAGKNMPKKDRLDRIVDALKCSPIDLTFGRIPAGHVAASPEAATATPAPKKITVQDAARLLGKSTQFVRSALQQNIAPFGFAVKGRGNKWVYHISPGKLFEYLRGA